MEIIRNTTKFSLFNKYKTTQQKSIRTFWGWLNYVFNKYDQNRVDEVGPDRAAAEWLLRNGAGVKWKGAGEVATDYNKLPVGNFERYKIEEIDGENSTIMSYGFSYLKNLQHLRKIVFAHNIYLDNRALEMLKDIDLTLKHLEIINCPRITDTGIKSLDQLKHLEYLKCSRLVSVKNHEACIDHLKACLSKLKIDWIPDREA